MRPSRGRRFDAEWLYEQERRYFDVFGHRERVGRLDRWTNPDNRDHREGNHGAVRPGMRVTADELIALLSLQEAESVVPCVDVYGEPGETDALCVDLGLVREQRSPVLIMAWERERVGRGAVLGGAEVRRIPAAQWGEAVLGLHPAGLSEMWKKALGVESTLEIARFYGVFEYGRVVSALARYDWPDIAQIESVRTHPGLRGQGLAGTCLATALAEAPHGSTFLLVLKENGSARRAYEKAGASTVGEDLSRRYVASWAYVGRGGARRRVD